MGLYKRKDSPFWWMSFRVDGRRIREATGTVVKKLAERIHAQRLTELAERGLDTSYKAKESRATFADLSAEYLKWAERQRSFLSKKSFIRLLGEAFGGLELRAFSTQLVEGYQTMCLKDGKAPATANRHVTTLKHMFTKAVEWELATEEALKKVRRVKLLEENNRRLRFLSREEGAALVNACAPHLKPIVVTALNTGMRKGEILSLEWERNVDLKHGFILLDMTKNGERREVPINQTLRSTLQRLVRRIGCQFVFANDEGRRLRWIKRSFGTALKRSGIKDFRFHDLRHTFASQLVMAGVDLTTVKELLGHKNLSMTLRYAHLAPSHKVKAVAVLEDGHDLVTLNAMGERAALKTP